jgi:uncharacterized protein DUF2442
MIKVTRARHLGDRRIELEFSSGEVGQVDLADLVKRSGRMVIPLRDPKAFSAFFLELGALAWANGFELGPETLYRKAREQGTLRKGRAA